MPALSDSARTAPAPGWLSRFHFRNPPGGGVCVRDPESAARAQGMEYVHDAGVVHRDLSTSNVLLSGHMQARPHARRSSAAKRPRAAFPGCWATPGEPGPGLRLSRALPLRVQVKIADFGCARLVPPGGAHEATTISGSPLFMSPEQLAGDPLTHKVRSHSRAAAAAGRAPPRGPRGPASPPGGRSRRSTCGRRACASGSWRPGACRGATSIPPASPRLASLPWTGCGTCSSSAKRVSRRRQTSQVQPASAAVQTLHAMPGPGPGCSVRHPTRGDPLRRGASSFRSHTAPVLRAVER